MVAPFQAQQFTDPRVAVLQNAFNAQNKIQLQSMENNNRLLTSGMQVGGALLDDYFKRKDDRNQGRMLLKQMGMGDEEIKDIELTAENILDYQTAQTNAVNAQRGVYDTAADTLQFLPDDESAIVADEIVGGMRGMYGGGGAPMVFGNKKTTAAPTAFGNQLAGVEPPVAEPGYNEEDLVLEETGVIPGSDPFQGTELSIDDQIESTIDSLEAGAPGSPMGRERQADKAALSSAESGAVSDRISARNDMRKDNELQFFAGRSSEVITDRYGEEYDIKPNLMYKSKVRKLNSTANLGKDAELQKLLESEDQSLGLANQILNSGETILEIYGKGGFKTEPGLIEGMMDIPGSMARTGLSAASKIGANVSEDNKRLTSAFDVYTNRDAKNLAKSLEGGGRLSDFDFTKALEQLGNMQMNPDLFRRKFFENVGPMIEDLVTTEMALGNIDVADDLAEKFKQLGQMAGVKIEEGEDGIPRVVDFADVAKGGAVKESGAKTFSTMTLSELQSYDENTLTDDELAEYVSRYRELIRGGK